MLDYFAGAWTELKLNRQNIDRFVKLAPSLCLYDLGASGGTPPPFCWLGDRLELISFEPNKQAEVDGRGRCCRVAIGPPELTKFYINRRPTTSSLLRAKTSVVSRYDFSRQFPSEPRIFETVSTEEVDVIGLDTAIRAYNLPCPSFMKIDVQGLTSQVLFTAKQALSESLLGIQVEVEFLETYEGQSTFGVVHDILCGQGFEIFRLTNLNRWPYKTNLHLRTYTGQDVFCDLLYLRGIDHLDQNPDFWTQSRIMQHLVICLLHDLPDFAAAFLEKSVNTGLLDVNSSKDIETLITEWTDAMSFFFIQPNRSTRPFKKAVLRFMHPVIVIMKAILPSWAYNFMRFVIHRQRS